MSVRDLTIESKSLAENRMVTMFFPKGYRPKTRYPVLFCADGQAVHGFSDRLCHAIERKDVRPVILVGVHSSQEYRAKEYLYGVDDQRFRAHEHFFTDEVHSWAGKLFNQPIERESCGVFGFSNGATFALSMAVRHRDKYGVVIAFSVAGDPGQVDESQYAQRPLAKHYISVGTRESSFYRNGRAVAEILKKQGADYVITERCAGHEFSFWDSELPEAIRWSFPPKQKGWLARIGSAFSPGLEFCGPRFRNVWGLKRKN